MLHGLPLPLIARFRDDGGNFTDYLTGKVEVKWQTENPICKGLRFRHRNIIDNRFVCVERWVKITPRYDVLFQQRSFHPQQRSFRWKDHWEITTVTLFHNFLKAQIFLRDRSER